MSMFLLFFYFLFSVSLFFTLPFKFQILFSLIIRESHRRCNRRGLRYLIRIKAVGGKECENFRIIFLKICWLDITILRNTFPSGTFDRLIPHETHGARFYRAMTPRASVLRCCPTTYALDCYRLSSAWTSICSYCARERSGTRPWAMTAIDWAWLDGVATITIARHKSRFR